MNIRSIESSGRLALVAEGNFIRATRDTGYRSTAAAVAELVDNAIQAGADKIRIIIWESEIASGRTISLAVLDNGSGMDATILRHALQFGGSSRFDDRSGLGRFGMGLPNSAVSQARRLEVMSWTASTQALSCQLDVDEVLRGRESGISEPRAVEIPPWAAEFVEDHGTLVIWSRCDRLEVRKGSTLAEKLKLILGRVYRRMIWAGVNITVNDVQVSAIDPLFVEPESGLGGGRPFGPPLHYSIELPDSGALTSVDVRFVELPVAQWNDLPNSEKRARRIVGGAGVSILRADREIDFGWHFMGSKRRENYDDWWRCEVSFTPEADELFGVTHSKQGITPGALLRMVLTPGIESVARELNLRARIAFQGVKASVLPSAAAASAKDVYLPAVSFTPRAKVRGDHFSYRVRMSPLKSGELFATVRRGSVITVKLNTEHAFIARVYAESSAGRSEPHRQAIERIVLAAARARLTCSDSHERMTVDRFINDWSDTLAAFADR